MGKRVMAVAIAVSVACGARVETTGYPTAATSTPSNLSEVQKECRASANFDIAKLNSGLGPGCNKPTMPVALDTFDLGSMAGDFSARRIANAQTLLCLCGATKCDGDQFVQISEAVQNAFGADENARRDGVAGIQERLRAHSCLDASVAAQLFSVGYDCAVVEGLTDARVQPERTKAFLRVFEGDEAQARELAARCMAKNGPAASSM